MARERRLFAVITSLVMVYVLRPTLLILATKTDALVGLYYTPLMAPDSEKLEIRVMV